MSPSSGMTRRVTTVRQFIYIYRFTEDTSAMTAPRGLLSFDFARVATLMILMMLSGCTLDSVIGQWVLVTADGVAVATN